MLRLTLDTNCVVNLFDFTSETATSVDELNGLIRHALQGAVNLCVTTAVQRDLDRDRDDERRASLFRKLELFPVIGGIFRLDASRPDGSDALLSDDEAVLESRLRATLFPGLTDSDKRHPKKVADIDHLLAHKLRGREIFVTDDKEDILRRREVLRDEFGITVMTPKEALEVVERTTNVRLVVEDYKRDFEELTRLLERHLTDNDWSGEESVRYGELRVRLLRAFPKFMTRLANFRWQQISQPTGGGYALTDAISVSHLQHDRDPFKRFYEREQGADVIEAFGRYYRDDFFESYADARNADGEFLSEAERARTLLEEFLGSLEGQPT